MPTPEGFLSWTVDIKRVLAGAAIGIPLSLGAYVLNHRADEIDRKLESKVDAATHNRDMDRMQDEIRELRRGLERH